MRRKSKNSSKKAFTLIEVLVATFILLVMVLILSKIYHQASVAWSAGFRRADGNMIGRSAVGFMARELMNSCADQEYFFEQGFYAGDFAQSVKFITLAGEPGEYGRVARQITYQHTGDGSLDRIERQADPNHYGAWATSSNKWCMVTNVQKVAFYTPDRIAKKNGKMPEWVGIRLTINRSDDVSGVGAASAGPDGVFGNDDDLDSW